MKTNTSIRKSASAYTLDKTVNVNYSIKYSKAYSSVITGALEGKLYLVLLFFRDFLLYLKSQVARFANMKELPKSRMRH